MYINDLEGNFGALSEDVKQWVNENLEGLEESVQLNITRALTDSKIKHLDISDLKRALFKVTGKKAKIFYWKVCMECGCEYAYGLPLCPDCYHKNLECRVYAVKKSEFQPPVKVIKYNKEFFPVEEDKIKTLCYDCLQGKDNLNYCKNFGNEKWNCDEESFHGCKCSACCVDLKSKNKEIAKERNEIKMSFARPLDKSKLIGV